MKSFWLVFVLLTQVILGLTEEEFQKLHHELQPDFNATWLTIPWKTSVLDAQAVAAREGKPIFIWAMDGHPLTCT